MSTVNNSVSGFGSFPASLGSATPSFAIGRQDGTHENLTIRIKPGDVGVNSNGRMPPQVTITGKQLEEIIFKHYGLDPDNAADRQTLNERLGTTESNDPFAGVKTSDTITLILDKKQYVFRGTIDTSLKQAIQGVAQTKNAAQPPTGENQNGQPIAGKNGTDEAARRRAELNQKMPNVPGLPPTGDMQRTREAIERFQKVMEGIGEYAKENPPTPEMLGEMVDRLQTVLDLIGIIDPTPLADGASGIISAAKGQFGYAALSMIAAVIPYAGDLLKLGKLPKIMKSGEEMVELAIKAPKITEEALETLSNFRKSLDDIPLENVPQATKEMIAGVRGKIDNFVEIEKKLKEVANGQVLKQGGWIGKEIKVGDKLPEGYHWKGEQISRNPNKAEANYAALQVGENGTIVLAKGERLSNANTMRKNFRAAIEADLSAQGLKGADLRKAVDAEMGRVQIHHLLPDETIQKTALGKAAQKAGYSLDNGENLKGMPRTAGSIKADETGHWTNHPEYTRQVTERMDQVRDELLQNPKWKTLNDVPPSVIKTKMKELETEFKTLIKDGNAPRRADGSLAKLEAQPPQPRQVASMLLGGRNDIRV